MLFIVIFFFLPLHTTVLATECLGFYSQRRISPAQTKAI